MSGMTDASEVAASIREAARDPSVREILLDVDSPGGSVNSIDVLASAVREARDTKPITAITEGTMASAAYWVASQASRIVASPNAAVGSISVIYTHTDRSKANERSGIRRTHITSGDRKNVLNTDAPLTDEGLAEASRLVGEFHTAFVDAVAAGRGLDPDRVQSEWADGRVETGTIAKRIGMIDDVGTLQDVVDQIRSEASRDRPSARAEQGEGVNLGNLHFEISAAPAERNTTVKLADVAAILRSGERVGAETDEPEGARRLEISDTLANAMADAIETEASALEEASAAVDEAEARATLEARERIVERALAHAELPPVSAESDEKFRVILRNTALAAEDNATATEAVTRLVEDRKIVLGANKSDNHPRLPTKPKQDSAANEAEKAIASVRASIPELN